jgi:hypothetical protein
MIDSIIFQLIKQERSNASQIVVIDRKIKFNVSVN